MKRFTTFLLAAVLLATLSTLSPAAQKQATGAHMTTSAKHTNKSKPVVHAKSRISWGEKGNKKHGAFSPKKTSGRTSGSAFKSGTAGVKSEKGMVTRHKKKKHTGLGNPRLKP